MSETTISKFMLTDIFSNIYVTNNSYTKGMGLSKGSARAFVSDIRQGISNNIEISLTHPSSFSEKLVFEQCLLESILGRTLMRYRFDEEHYPYDPIVIAIRQGSEVVEVTQTNDEATAFVMVYQNSKVKPTLIDDKAEVTVDYMKEYGNAELIVNHRKVSTKPIMQLNSLHHLCFDNSDDIYKWLEREGYSKTAKDYFDKVVYDRIKCSIEYTNNLLSFGIPTDTILSMAVLYFKFNPTADKEKPFICLWGKKKVPILVFYSVTGHCDGYFITTTKEAFREFKT